MKKLLLLVLLVAAFGQVFGQDRNYTNATVYYTRNAKDSAAWGTTSNWASIKYTGNSIDLSSQKVFNSITNPVQAMLGTKEDFPGTTASAANTENNIPSAFVIRSGQVLYFQADIFYNGHIIVEAGAQLLFYKTTSAKGRLIMDENSMIEIRPGGQIGAATANGQSFNADFLEIGGVKIMGKLINDLPDDGITEPLYINKDYLNCRYKNVCNTPQPVDLLSYNVNVQNNDVVAEWVASREVNFSHYVVEWSADGKEFYAAGSVSARGTEAGAQRYSFRHKPGQNGTLYYRLLGVDIDGTVEEKGIRVVRIGSEQFNAYTKQGRLHINYNGPSESIVTVFDTSGRLIKTDKLSSEGIEVAGVTPGMYLVNISNSLEKKTQRVVIN